MAVANVTSIVLPGKFEPHKDKWENYKEQLFFALEAAGHLETEQKRALFLSQCGKEAFALIVSLLSPRKPSQVPFEEIISVLDKFFIPKPHPVIETEKFYNRKQKRGETITSFVAALHDISSRCEFKDLERRIAEQLILGIWDENIKKELLKIKLEHLSYDYVVQQALNFESIQQNKEGNAESKIHFEAAGSSANKGEPMDINAISNQKPCVHCAKHHGNARCRFLNATCYKCHKKGHIQAACGEKIVNKPKMRVNECDDCGASSEEDKANDEDSFGVHGVAGEARIKPFMVEVLLNGVPVVMEVDSGSSRSILPHSVYLQIKNRFPEQLTPFKNKLVTWTNDALKIKGEMTVDVELKDKKVKLPLLVSCGKGPALLGRAWFESLGISVYGVNSVSEEKEKNFSQKFPQLFDDKMNQYKGPMVHIDCKEGTTPVFQRARPVPFPLREKVNEELKRMMAEDIITPVKHSQWATPLRIVPKPDGTLRLCGDYRSTVNAACLIDSYPLPTANEGFFELSGGKFFSKIDLKHAYNQVKVDEPTANLLTLNTPLGLMKMNRLAYGVNAATAIFQRLMSNLLAGIEGVACLLDDVVVSGSTMEEHDQRVEAVLQRLDEMGLKLNRKKCAFAAQRVTFLGYEIDETGIHPTKEKIQEITDKPAPKDKKTLKAFLGLYNFYERFLMEKAIVLQPLYTLLKEKVKWQWGKTEQEAFENAKKLLTSDLTLVHYSLERELLLLCDASEYGVGAVLVHKMDDGTEKPVIMSSRTLQDHERRYAQIDKEALAIMFGLNKFRQYLIGRKFVICSDHKPLLGIFGRGKPIPELISARMLRWALMLNTFDYEIQYRPGKALGNADSLSRMPTPSTEGEEEIFLLEPSDLIGVNSKKIAKETDKDQVLKRVKFYLLHGWPDKVDSELLPFQRRKESLSLSKECILWANRVVIPKSMQQIVLKALHEGHCGVVQTKMLARAYVWFPTLDVDIENLIAQCDACQLNRNNPPVTEHSWPAANKAWSRVNLDFMGPFMGKTFLVLVDAYSKWPVIEMVSSMSSKTVIDILKKVFADQGLPDLIVSDNGLAFTGAEFQNFVKKNQIQHLTGAPYHPATNGQAERTIQTIKNKLKKVSDLPWQERIIKVLFHMRTSPSIVTGKSPAEMLNGRKFRTALSQLHPDTDLTPDKMEEKEEDKTKGEGRKIKRFSDGDQVLLRIYNMNQRWKRGIVIKQVAPALYEIRTEDGTVHRRHVDQLLRTRSKETQTNYDQRNVTSDDDTDSVVMPPPEECPEIIGY